MKGSVRLRIFKFKIDTYGRSINVLFPVEYLSNYSKDNSFEKRFAI